jgi:hypothetical protein
MHNLTVAESMSPDTGGRACHMTAETEGQMTQQRPKPRPSAGSRRIDPLDEDQFFIKNRNGKRPALANVFTGEPPSAPGETVLPDVPHHKRPRYEDPVVELVTGPRLRIPVTKPDFVMGPVKRGVRAKKP